MDELLHRALNWETLLAVTKEEKADTVYEAACQEGIVDQPLLLHTAFYAEQLGLDTSVVGDAYLVARPFFEEMDESVCILDETSPQWPSTLNDNPYKPRFLYTKGNLQLLEEPLVSIVGTRSPSLAGRQLAHRSAKALGNAGFTVVGGLGLGIEAAAHQSALLSDRPTMAVLSTSLERAYPLQHADLQEEIGKRGLSVSRFGPASKTQKIHLFLRNRLMAALSSAMLVIEDRDGGTAVSQATDALERGKPVLLYQLSLDNSALLWPQRLVAHDLATVVKRTQDLGRITRRVTNTKPVKKVKKKPSGQLDLFTVATGSP